MSPRRAPAALLAAIAVAGFAAGCGLGPGESSEGEATLTVTRSYGAETLLEASATDPAESETVIRFLDREAEITTRYGGGFVQSIDGIEGDVAAGRSHDWFFFVNGIEADRGSAEVAVRGGDRIWWDYRDWTDALRTPAVIGSWPEPFAQAGVPDDDREPVALECLGGGEACERVGEALDSAGAELAEAGGDGGPRVLVGPWRRLRLDPDAAQIERGPATSGVFARFERFRSGFRLLALDPAAERVREDDSGAGLLAAVRRGDRPPTWVVTGVDAAGVEQAAAALGGGDLAQRYALFASDEVDLPLPAKQVED